MALSLKTEHLKRYKEIALLLFRHGHSGLLEQAGLDHLVTGETAPPTREEKERAEELARSLEEMGPIYVKLGQVFSSRPDLLPPVYIKALSRLQDRLEPLSFSIIEETVEAELGVRISKAFLEFNAEPMATASLGQVHSARLRNGKEVVVKVQRPNVRNQIRDDMEVLRNLVEFVDAHTDVGRRFKFGDVLEEFRTNLYQELDYRQEARNMIQIGESLKEYPDIVIPQPVQGYSTGRVLTMDFIHGRKITEMGPLAQLEMDGYALADQLFSAYLKMFLVDGLFHADPHPGNVLLTYDYKVALIDLGMVGRISPGMQEQLLKLLLAITEGRSDDACDIGIQIGEPLPEFEERDFRRRIADLIEHQRTADVESMNIGSVISSFSQVTGSTGIRMPSELAMFGKTLLNLDDIGKTLAPRFNPNDAIRRNSAELMRQRMMKSLSPGHVLSTALETKEFIEELPRRVNRILDAVAENDLKVHVEAIDEVTLVEGFQKIANRITVGLILAALIIGASMLMDVETDFEILGYPGLAMICFIGAAIGGIWLILSILLTDQSIKKHRKIGGLNDK